MERLMDTDVRHRIVMVGLGALSGICLYLLFELLEGGQLPERAILASVVFAAVFFAALLSLAGPMKIVPSALGAVVLALCVAGLVVLTSLRFETVEDMFDGPFHFMAGFAISAITLPFLIGLAGAGWRDYPTLFDGAWGVVVRAAAAGVFTGIVWGVIFLSDQLLQVVGLDVISQLLDIDMVPWIITGATYGLALAVVHELRAYVSPHLILRLLRLLVPVVLVVMAVFIVALPFRGLSEVFDTLSAGATMLAMVGAGVTLVSVTIDKDDAQATGSAWLAQAARALAAILVIPAALGCYAVWLRVAEYGWTPERLFAALAAGIGLIYGLIYLMAVVRGTGWMARVRQANIGMAGLVVLVAALWLTPMLNAERISANSQAARFAAGEMEISEISPWEYGDWGKPGEAFLATLRAKAAEPGQAALAAQLESGGYGDPAVEPAAQLALMDIVKETMPLQPGGATAVRDRILAGVSPYELEVWRDACARTMPNGNPGCVMVVADLISNYPGDEAIVYQFNDPTFGSVQGFALDGNVVQWKVVYAGDQADFQSRPMEVITALQAGPPTLTPVTTYELTVGGIGLRMDPW
jgi:hypothetical protein